MVTPDNMPTMPNPALQPNKRDKVSAPVPAPPAQQRRRSAPRDARQPARRPLPPAHRKRRGKLWLWAIPATLGVMLLMFFGLMILVISMVYGRGILPGVNVGDVALGGMSPARAATELSEAWTTLTLRDDDRSWNVSPSAMGITLKVEETVELAYSQGRGEGNPLAALLGEVTIPPVIRLDMDAAIGELARLLPEFEVAPVNAGVAFENGDVVATPPRNGRTVDINGTLQRLQRDPETALSGGELQLVMRDVTPDVTDASPLVAQARAILNNPLDIQVFDPVTGDSVYWSLPPSQWGRWLSAQSDPNSAIGLTLTADDTLVRDYLTAQANTALDASRSIDIEAGVASILDALAAGRPQSAAVTIKHESRTHTVSAGETITSIAWDYGIPYLYIQQANNGIEAVSIGQKITIPPADSFLLKPVIPNKRIVVDMSRQRVYVYENGQLKWDWLASTGVNDSPTWPGVYQIISHHPNAYAGNWNLYMPYFMGVYMPVPGADFTNGFHGFPTRGGGQILWTNNLGSKVTYGCIMLSDTNVRQLYDWAEDGVVVEIRG